METIEFTMKKAMRTEQYILLSCAISCTSNNFKLLTIVPEEDLCSKVLVLPISVQGERAFIALGDKEVECNPNFRMYLATKLSNPVFNPGLYAKANVIDCTVTALVSLYRSADKSLARPERKQATATEVLSFIYPIYNNNNWRNIITTYIHKKTSIKRNILTIKNTSGIRSG